MALKVMGLETFFEMSISKFPFSSEEVPAKVPLKYMVAFGILIPVSFSKMVPLIPWLYPSVSKFMKSIKTISFLSKD